MGTAQLITSLRNQRVKDAVRLRDRRGRQKQGRIIIDGVREIGRAVAAGVELVELFVCTRESLEEETHRVIDAALASGAEVLNVSPAVFDKLAFGQRAEGIVAAAVAPRAALADVGPRLADDALIAIVEDVEKPGNLGAVVRTADAAGVGAVVAVGGGTDLYNPATIRASLGCVFSLPVASATSDETITWLHGRGARLITARVDGAVDYTQPDYRGAVAIVLGSEAEGLSDAWRTADATAVRLPMLGVADSLNVSATAAVLFYEALRQRTQGKR